MLCCSSPTAQLIRTDMAAVLWLQRVQIADIPNKRNKCVLHIIDEQVRPWLNHTSCWLVSCSLRESCPALLLP